MIDVASSDPALDKFFAPSGYVDPTQSPPDPLEDDKNNLDLFDDVNDGDSASPSFFDAVLFPAAVPCPAMSDMDLMTACMDALDPATLPLFLRLRRRLMHSSRRSFTTSVLAISLISPWMPLLHMLLASLYGCLHHPSAGRALQAPQLSAGRALQAPQLSAGRAIKAPQLLVLGRALVLVSPWKELLLPLHLLLRNCCLALSMRTIVSSVISLAICLLLHLGYGRSRNLPFIRFVSSNQMLVLAHQVLALEWALTQLIVGRALPLPDLGRTLTLLVQVKALRATDCSVSGEGKNFKNDENRSANQAVEMSVMIHRLQSDNWPASWDAAFDAQMDAHHGMGAIGWHRKRSGVDVDLAIG